MDLVISGLRASIEGKPILRGIDLTLKAGEIAALMGPNGSGKSTLANVLMGHPAYVVESGSVRLGDAELLDLPVHERAALGLFLAFQYPVEIPGVSVGKFLKRAVEARAAAKARAGGESAGGMNVSAYIKELRAAMDSMGVDQSFINRALNEGFSGGEKKRMEVLQMLMLKPRFAIMDETDSGLDIDALKVVANGANRLRGPDFGALVITHYQRILQHLRPDVVHVMYKGKIVVSGGPELVGRLEGEGYDWVREEAAAAPAEIVALAEEAGTGSVAAPRRVSA
jgi:Fe-S cluster assembly ATP-binding protein